jgi:hypothetical protein
VHDRGEWNRAQVSSKNREGIINQRCSDQYTSAIIAARTQGCLDRPICNRNLGSADRNSFDRSVSHSGATVCCAMRPGNRRGRVGPPVSTFAWATTEPEGSCLTVLTKSSSSRSSSSRSSSSRSSSSRGVRSPNAIAGKRENPSFLSGLRLRKSRALRPHFVTNRCSIEIKFGLRADDTAEPLLYAHK